MAKNDNIKTVEGAISKAVKTIDDIRGQREELAGKALEVFAKLENDYGIHRDAVRLALKVRDMELEKRLHFDIAYQLMRLSTSEPVQSELFESDIGGLLDKLSEFLGSTEPEDGQKDIEDKSGP